MENPVIIALVIGVVIVVVIIASIAAKRRRQELAAFAATMGFSYTRSPGMHYRQYERFHPFGRGGSRRASNLVHGMRGQFDWEFFDYRYATGSGKNRKVHCFGIALAKVSLSFAHLEIRPEGFFDKVAATFGFDDIDFESDEFSRKYFVKCANRKMAYDLIHPRMIEYMLRSKKSHWQFDGDTIMICRGGRFSSVDLPGVMALIEGFVERIPDYVLEDIGRGDVVNSRQRNA